MMGRSGEGDGGWRKDGRRQLCLWDGRSRWSGLDEAGRSDLSGASSEGECDAAPRGEVGRGARQMQDDAADGADDVDAQLQEPVAEPGHLGPRTSGACGAQPKLLQEHVGGGGQQDAELVRCEPAAAGAVDL